MPRIDIPIKRLSSLPDHGTPKSATQKTRKYLFAIAFKLESKNPYRPRLAREAAGRRRKPATSK
jgi:hypothetical protein